VPRDVAVASAGRKEDDLTVRNGVGTSFCDQPEERGAH
jgi:hypothetical protein